MLEFHCGCGTLYVGLSTPMLCPCCKECNQSTGVYTYSPETTCHQAGQPYGQEMACSVPGLPKLALSVQEYKAWDLRQRCFWAGCGGHMRVNESGVGRCSVCKGRIRVFLI